MIESLYVVDSSGLCLYSSALTNLKQAEPNLVCGFIVAQFQYFRETYGEDTRKFTLERKELLMQTFQSGGNTIILAITYTSGSQREEKFSAALLEKLANALKPKDEVFSSIETGIPKALETGIGDLVEEVFRKTSCLYLVKGFMALADHCDKIDAPTGGRPCNFGYAVRQCEYYSPKPIDDT